MNNAAPTRTKIRARLSVLLAAFGVIAVGGLVAAPAASAESETIFVDTVGADVEVIGDYQVDCEASPHTVTLSFTLENQTDTRQVVDFALGYRVTLEPAGAPGQRKPLYETYAFTGTELQDSISTFDPDSSAAPEVIDSETFTCDSPATPPQPGKVCVLSTAPGTASIAWGTVARTYHFSSSVKLPKTCVTESVAKAWAEKLGIHLERLIRR
ncbi:hypothetical protein AAIB33_06155 [Microbacterium sp. AZCO]|uniref:hypothetical protein n=1 Tax=Microbacterium sp. AZCO TaxID=3142976 RepID=UPI0031F37B06